MGPFKDTFGALLDSAIIILQTVKGLILLIPQDGSDLLRIKELELEIAVLDAGLSVATAPLGTLQAYAKPWADCPPVATLVTTFNKFVKMLISDIVEKKFEVEQQIDDINIEGDKNAELDRWLGVLEDFKDAITACG